MNFLFRLLVSLLLLFLSSCGYETSGRGVQVGDEHYERIAIPAFHNASFEPGAEVYITKALRENMVSSGFLDLASNEDADIILHGKVASLGNTVLALDRLGSGMEYRLVITINYELTDRLSKEKIFSDSVSGTWDYKYTANTIDNRVSLSEAITNLSDQLAQEIVLMVREHLEQKSRKE